MDNIDEIRMSIKRNRLQYFDTKEENLKENETKSKNRYIVFLISRVLLCIILFLSALIYVKIDKANKTNIENIIYKENFSFATINKFYKTYLGGILPFDKLFKEDIKPVFNNKLEYKESSVYKDGVKLTVSSNYLVPVIESGMIVFIGEKEGYGKTVIIQQVNGVDIWYSNLSNINVKIYDYVEKGSLLGEVGGNELYLTYQKEGKFLDYHEFIE